MIGPSYIWGTQILYNEFVLQQPRVIRRLRPKKEQSHFCLSSLHSARSVPCIQTALPNLPPLLKWEWQLSCCLQWNVTASLFLEFQIQLLFFFFPSNSNSRLQWRQIYSLCFLISICGHSVRSSGTSLRLDFKILRHTFNWN